MTISVEKLDDGMYQICLNDGHSLALSAAELWDLLCILHDQHKLELYQASKHASAKSFQENAEHAPFETCTCSTCTFIRSVLDGEQEPHRYI